LLCVFLVFFVYSSKISFRKRVLYPAARIDSEKGKIMKKKIIAHAKRIHFNYNVLCLIIQNYMKVCAKQNRNGRSKMKNCDDFFLHLYLRAKQALGEPLSGVNL
jgi:hypothetical protein